MEVTSKQEVLKERSEKAQLDDLDTASGAQLEGQAAESGEPLSPGRYEPRDLDELMRYCKIVVQSQLCPRHIKSPADAMLIIQRGAELGLSAVNALQNLNVINGNVTMPAALAVGVVKASEACEYFICVESTEEYSTWETKRRGNPQPTRYTFSRHDAQVAGLWGSGTWRRYPRNLLAARASMNLARIEYQDVLVGVYTPEELEVTAAPRAGAASSTGGRSTGRSRKNSSSHIPASENTLTSENTPAPQNTPTPENRRPAREKTPIAEAEQPKQAEELSPAPEPAVVEQAVVEQDAQAEEAGTQTTRALHWSEAPLENARDRSRTKAWQRQNARYHALMKGPDLDEYTQPFRQFIKERHRAAAWGVLPAELIQKWCDLIEKYEKLAAQADFQADDPSPRARWVEQMLRRHARVKAGLLD